MTSRGTKYWDSGAIPLIGPDILGDIIASLSDLAIVISDTGQILSVLSNPIHRSYVDLKEWERRNVREVLTDDSVPKFERALHDYLDDSSVTRPVELNHYDHEKKWQFPINYTLNKIGPDQTILMLGRDMRPVAEMQQQLVKAQIALEKDYESQREYDTRFQVLLGHINDAVAFVSVGEGRITELNNAAARLLGKKRENIQGSSFVQELKGISRADLMDRLSAAAQVDGAGGIEVEAARTGEKLRIVPTLFRAAGERMFLCRFSSVDGNAIRDDEYTRSLIALCENGSDGIVMTDNSGGVTSANEAFLNLVDAADGRSLRGRQIADFMSRGNVDQKVLMDHAARVGSMRLYTTRIVGEYGGQRPVTVSATLLNSGYAPCYAFVFRDAQVSELPAVPGVATAEEEARPLMELVGSATLKEIVSQTTDVVEKMCIETAIQLTNNNRVASADMLGLSRQSLYVKLRKYGLLAKES
ncbi:MAG: transcriptional regulator PpsR [Roseovarius sp.]